MRKREGGGGRGGRGVQLKSNNWGGRGEEEEEEGYYLRAIFGRKSGKANGEWKMRSSKGHLLSYTNHEP